MTNELWSEEKIALLKELWRSKPNRSSNLRNHGRKKDAIANKCNLQKSKTIGSESKSIPDFRENRKKRTERTKAT